jgi:hypothetical protein
MDMVYLNLQINSDIRAIINKMRKMGMELYIQQTTRSHIVDNSQEACHMVVDGCHYQMVAKTTCNSSKA